MFEATFIQGSVFRQIIEALRDLVTDVNIECTMEGMRAQAMEPSHISLASMKISSSAFDSYRCDRNLVLGLNIISVSKILKCMESDDSLSISAGEKSDIVNFCITSKKLDRISNFELKLININPETLSIPEEQADVEVRMPSCKFSQICKSLSTFGDTVKINATKTCIDFVSEGSLGAAKLTVKPTEEYDDNDDGVQIECRDGVEQSYSQKFLNFFCKSQVLCKVFVIHLSNSSPLCLECLLNDDWGYIKYYLAPKIQENEDQED